MTTLVCFRTGDGEYAVPIECVREVRAGTALMPLPSAQEGVAGLLSYSGTTLTVVSTLGAGGDQVLLLEHGNHAFGLLVDQVTRVLKVEGQIDPAPRGQAREYISGVVSTDDGPLFVIDVDVLDERLGP
jgi:chemotaxis signal transduction protein